MELSAGWQRKKLGEIATSIKGKRPDKLYDKNGADLIPYINIKAFETGKFDYYTTGKDCRVCEENDLLIVWDGSRSGLVGKAYKGAICSTIARIDIDGVLNGYGYYFLLSNYQYLNTNTKGSGTPHVDPVLLWDLDIPVPSKPIQHRIVEKIEELFSDLDNGISTLKKAKQQLETYKQSVLKAAFEGKLTKEWREQQDELPTPEELNQQIEEERKNYREQQLKEWEQKVEGWKEEGEPGRKPRKPRKIRSTSPIKNEDVADKRPIPDGWTWTRVGDIGKVGTGSTPLKKKKELYYDGGKIPWVTSGALNDWYVDEASGFVTQKALEETNLTVYPKHTLLVAMYGEGKTRGKSSELLIEACTNQAIAAIVQEGTETKTRQFLKYFFLKNYNDIRRLSSGGVQPNLNLGIIRDTLVPLPSLKEQEKIVDELESRLSVVQQIETTISKELNKAKALRQSILKKAFEGELVSQEISEKKFQKPLQKYYKNTATDLHAGLMAKIIRLHHQNDKYLNKLNHVKCEKNIHMIESHLGVDLQRQPVKDAAGPDDYTRLKKIEHRANLKNWFVKDTKLGGEFGYGYKPKKSIAYAISGLSKVENLPMQEINDMINLFLPMDKEQAEVVATLYAAWNNFLIESYQPTDDEIVQAARKDWSKQKLRIKRHNFVKALSWMRKKELIPSGNGKYVKDKTEN